MRCFMKSWTARQVCDNVKFLLLDEDAREGCGVVAILDPLQTSDFLTLCSRCFVRLSLFSQLKTGRTQRKKIASLYRTLQQQSCVILHVYISNNGLVNLCELHY